MQKKVHIKESHTMETTFNPFDNFAAENKAYVETLFSGKMKIMLIICHECGNIFCTESGPVPEEYSTSYCPFCKSKAKQSIKSLKGDPDTKIANINKAIIKGGFAPLDNNLEEKMKRVLMDTQNQVFNVGACTECQNRFVLLEEDIDEVKNCPFCGTKVDNLVLLFNDVSNEQSEKTGLESCIGKLFYVKTARFEENFILTNIDYDMNKYRFVSLTDKRMAMWLDNSEIYEMYEFVDIQTNTITEDSELPNLPELPEPPE